jgi:hypothetical protein
MEAYLSGEAAVTEQWVTPYAAGQDRGASVKLHKAKARDAIKKFDESWARSKPKGK